MSLTDVITDEIVRELNNDRLVLPSLPEVAFNIRDALESDDIDVRQLKTIVSLDAGLSARIISVANSAMFKGLSDINDLSSAITRLGFAYTSKLAIGYSMKHLFQATNSMVSSELQNQWKLSVDISNWCLVLAKHTEAIPYEEAMLAGLFHRLGALPILSFAEQREDLIQDSFSLIQLIERLHSSLGSIILDRWEFPEIYVKVPKLYKKVSRQSKSLDHVSIVTLASLIYFRGKKNDFDLPDWSEVSLFEQFGLPNNKEDDIYDYLAKKVGELSDI